jgi:hypothetical protein
MTRPITIVAVPGSIITAPVSVAFRLLASHLVLAATFATVVIIVMVVEESLSLPQEIVTVVGSRGHSRDGRQNRKQQTESYRGGDRPITDPCCVTR